MVEEVGYMGKIIYIVSNLYSVTVSASRVRVKPVKVLNCTEMMLLLLNENKFKEQQEQHKIKSIEIRMI